MGGGGGGGSISVYIGLCLPARPTVGFFFFLGGGGGGGGLNGPLRQYFSLYRALFASTANNGGKMKKLK